ncbi:FAD-dependent oxidoreductase [Mesobacillus maritimus]|uniref:NAD(P)/FAD-dependent oxidoreductase n=1 Tax=Mesobacillus maritimus TaxID=1643336 RepID=UPI00203FD8AD|nr:FAD-dependent oxidoreductase [Mesobacillus maritimus]MCM3588197.1 FAD-dependent oxidoreductase [Mesobacillus maritimus]
MPQTYCVIGSGVAAVNAAKAIRDQDQDGKIILFGSEPALPYNRIKLSKELFSDLTSSKVLLKKEKWYEKNSIEIVNKKITRIEPNSSMIVTADGATVEYDKLLICTGAKNRKLPIEGVDLPGVYTIRERQEAEDFKAFIVNKENVVNVGGGIQGIETAWSLHKAGKKVSIIEAAPRLMARQLDERTSKLLQQKVEAAGVRVYVNTGIEKVEGADQVSAVIAGGESIPCDSVIYSIGVIPELELVSGSDIQTNRGIIVNERMETSVQGIYAAGDVTELNGVVEGLWGRAMDQGKVAGHNMASQTPVDYQKATPITVLNAFNLELFSIGMVDESQCDATITEESDEHPYTRVFIKENKLVGVIAHEGVAESLPYKNVIESQVSLMGIDFSQISIAALLTEVTERLTVSL